MTAFSVSGLIEVLDEFQSTPTMCSATPNGQFQQCTELKCPVFNYDDIDTHLCTAHETYMRGAIFRRRFPGFETTALVSGDQSIPSVPGPAAEDVRIVHGNGATTVFEGAQLDELTAGLHPQIKDGILQYINDYILFLGNSPYKHDNLSRSGSHFGARYRQQVLENDKVSYGRLGNFEKECRLSGCVWLVQVKPTTDAIERMDAEGQEASGGVALMVGFTSNLKSRLNTLRGCSIDSSALVTFPDTLHYKRKCRQPLPLVELLAGIVHEILVAHQHDIWCPCKPQKGRTHTQVYWFKNPDVEGTFYELRHNLYPKIQKWHDALIDAHERIRHLL